MIHFDLEINVDGYEDKWGGYVLEFPICTSATANDGLLPYGTTISSVTMKAYEGKIDEKTDLFVPGGGGDPHCRTVMALGSVGSGCIDAGRRCIKW